MIYLITYPLFIFYHEYSYKEMNSYLILNIPESQQPLIHFLIFHIKQDYIYY